jgi:hypothetical protein
VKGRDQPEGESRRNRHDGREQQHASVELDLLHARQARFGQRGQQAESPDGGQQPHNAASRRQQQALGQNRPRHIPPVSAERAADCNRAAREARSSRFAMLTQTMSSRNATARPQHISAADAAILLPRRDDRTHPCCPVLGCDAAGETRNPAVCSGRTG